MNPVDEWSALLRDSVGIGPANCTVVFRGLRAFPLPLPLIESTTVGRRSRAVALGCPSPILKLVAHAKAQNGEEARIVQIIIDEGLFRRQVGLEAWKGVDGHAIDSAKRGAGRAEELQQRRSIAKVRSAHLHWKTKTHLLPAWQQVAVADGELWRGNRKADFGSAGEGIRRIAEVRYVVEREACVGRDG